MPLQSDLHPLGIPFIELQSVDSTNKHAMGIVHEGRAEHGIAVFAHEQTAGKGQRGKAWNSGKDSNIALSIVINPFPLKPSEVFQLSVCVAVAARDFFSEYAGDETKIKWPNDIYWRDRKAGGVLIENVIRSREPGTGNWQWSVIGIGININQTSFSPDLPNPISLRQITGKSFDTIVLAKKLCEILDKYFSRLIAGEFNNIFERYLGVLYKRNEKVKLKKDNRVFEVVIGGVAETGQLIVQHASEERFDFGEVEWVL